MIGLLGPYSALLQNLVLAIAIMGAAATAFIWIPMTIGKIVLCIDPVLCVQALARVPLRKPLSILRYLIDPVIDITFEIIKEVLFKPGFAAFCAAERILARKLGLETFISQASRMYSGLFGRIFARRLGLLGATPRDPWDTSTGYYDSTAYNHPWEAIRSKMGSDRKDVGYLQALLRNLAQITGMYWPELPATNVSIPVDGIAILDAFEWLGNRSYRAYEAYRTACVNLATSDKLGENVLCALIGYLSTIAVTTSLAWTGEQGHIRVAQGWKAGLRRYRLFVKVSLLWLCRVDKS